MPSPGFPGRLKEQMEVCGVSVRRLAELSDIDPSTINLWRTEGQKRYRVENVRKVAPHLATTAEVLLELEIEEEGEEESNATVSESIPVAEVELLRRLASLRPRLNQLVPELEELLQEAERASRPG